MNITLKSRVEDDDDDIVEDSIVQGNYLLGGIKGTAVYLVEASTKGTQNLINRKFVDARIKTRSIHDIIWNDGEVTITENSGITGGIIVGKETLDRYTNYDLEIGVTITCTSNKDAVWSNIINEKVIETVSTMNPCNTILSPKATDFSKALQNIGIVSTDDDDIITTNPLKRGWLAHPGNSKFKLNDECIINLIQLYEKGKCKNNKSYRVTTE